MKNLIRIACIMLGAISLSAQTTPNLHFNVPAFNTPNWNVPLNQNMTLLDNYLSGNTAIPGLNINGGLATIGVSGSGCTRALLLTNIDSSPTNPNKYWRVNASTGAIELMNSACTTTIFSIDDSGNILGNQAFSGAAIAFQNAITIGTRITSYDGIATTGNGVPSIVGAFVSSALNANLSAQTVVTAPATNAQCPGGLTANCSVYEVSWYINTAAIGTSCVGNTTFVFNILYTDPLGSSQNTIASSTITITTNGTLASLLNQGVVPILAKQSTTVQISVTGFSAGGSCAPVPKYQITAIVKAIA